MKDNNETMKQEFAQVHDIIALRRSRALQTVNNENLLAAWEVGAFVFARLKNAAWGSKTVMQLSEYLRSQDPTLRGYSRRNIYNMVALYETYSSAKFIEYQDMLKLNQCVPSETAQIEHTEIMQSTVEWFQKSEIAQFETGQIVQFQTAQFPKFLSITTLTNHFEIINTCKTLEERIFYVLYSHTERLNIKELRRCLKNHTFLSLMGDKHNLSKGLKEIYPQATLMLKDTIFIDFLGLPQKHSEKRLQRGILENMKDFILELGKDFLFVDKEFPLQVGSSTFKVDLLFFHRGLQCLVAIELKIGKFKPEYMGQLEFYLEALDRDVRCSNENPSIGILLCQEADRSVIEYAMSRSLSPTMVAEYERRLIPKEVLQRSLEGFMDFLNAGKINN
ncbi:MAG: PDDEXK nuclease domain-containing protein [Puniceicoccales bacterium]|jgi:predicted nuclease of restriction endonuclease-like (RecB) superfamily|nr:PDDEXK nuclease domain-containing protein [Puniceicoccales bacterium]